MPRVARIVAQLCGVAVVLVVGWVAGSALDDRAGAIAKPSAVAEMPGRSLPALRVLAELEVPPGASISQKSETRERSRVRRPSRAGRAERARTARRRSGNRVARTAVRRVKRRSLRTRQAARTVVPAVQAAPPVVHAAPSPPPVTATPTPAPSPPPSPAPAPQPAAPNPPPKPAPAPAAVAFDDSA